MSLAPKDRKCLVITQNELIQKDIQYKVSSHVEGFNFVIANKINEGMFKIENDPPDIVFIDPSLANLNLTKFVHWLFKSLKKEMMALIILAHVPEESQFVDEIVLGKIHFLPDLNDNNRLAQVLSRALNYIGRKYGTEFHLRFLAPGDLLINEGEKGKNVYILKNGKLEAFLVRGEKNKHLGFIQPGEFVGEMAYINGEARSASVRAESDSELIEIEANQLDHVLFEKPAWTRALMQTLSRRLKRTIET